MRETVIKQGPGLGGLVAARAAYMLIRTFEVKFLPLVLFFNSDDPMLLLIGIMAFQQVSRGQSCCSILPIDCRSNMTAFYPFSLCRCHHPSHLLFMTFVAAR